MKLYTKRSILFLLIAALLFVACSNAPAEVVEVTRIGTDPIAVDETTQDNETIVVEGESVVVTRVVTEIVTEQVEVEAVAPAEESADAAVAGSPLPLATAPAGGTTPEQPPAPRVEVTPSAMFFEEYGVNPYILTEVDNLSTFSLDVDTGSYSIARRYLQDGLMPPPEAIRVEEFVNSFDQGYAIPPNTAFAVYADGAPSPFHTDGTYFLRIGVQGYESSEEVRPSANLVFVIDVSGSMAQENRLGLVKQSLEILVNRMRADDTIGIVVYGSDARVVLPPTNGSDRSTILSAIYSLETEGSTNLEAGLLLGYEQANRAYKFDGINRVILASDGVANVGNTSADGIAAQIRGYADSGIQLTTIGFGLGNYNDIMMEQLADQGDGNYGYIDTLEEAENLFVDNIMSTLQVIGLDAKIQVEFDPNVVQQYRLIGYENRAIADEDFRNDTIDAAEFGAGHTAVAIYAVQLVPGAQGRIATVNLRWQDPDTRVVKEINGVFTTENLARSFDEAPLHYQLAVVVSQYAELLRDSYWVEGFNMRDLQIRAERLASQMNDEAVWELANLISYSR
ncbi:MAG: von Willebrand factor type A domain-containing protein [Anaerolineales bacterium]|nr:von Willebrand factor type A domain-containing protein [Anaerolineales bacterium]MCB8940146.1 von Willebrand factor type A domain-containing protein [Ardenticatenaceae bacterium]